MSIQTSLQTLEVENLPEKGIPELYSEAFFTVAKNNDCVVMTREPGEACGMLLAQDYDGKGFFIKAKSCNWGAMAGFVCLDPILNKNAFGGAWSNLKENLHSLKDVYEDGKKAGVTQIIISQERLDWLIKNGKIAGGYTEDKQFYSGTSAEDDLTINFLLVKESNNRWALFYDLLTVYNSLLKSKITEINEIATLADAFQTKLEGRDKKEFNSKTFEEYWKLVSDKQYLKKFAELKPKLSGLDPTGCYYPVMAMTNPHQPYSGDLAYLNGVTGDFDLYAVWPKVPNEDDNRIVGMKSGMTNEDIIKGEKSARLAKLIGNISQRVFNIGQEINSLILHQYPQNPNRVFHSDEAGRPFVDSVDSAVAFTPDKKIYKIQNAKDLGNFINMMSDQGYSCYVNKGWEEPLKKEFGDSIISKLKWAKSINNV
jgi:hypothetical protein